jgi:hypothetical protein
MIIAWAAKTCLQQRFVMTVRPMLFTALTVSFLAGWAADAPRTTRYRVETKVEQVIDLSAVGQAEQRNDLTLANFLTITFDDTVGGQAIHAVLDSIVKLSTGPMPPQDSLDGARGRTWHALLAPDGKISDVKRVDTTSSGPVGDLITNFFPRVRPGAKVGDQWTDTTETTSDQDGQALTTRTVTNYSVTGTEARNGARALKVETAFSLAQTGEINQGGQSLSVDGSGSGTATYYVTQDGRYLGGTSATTAELQITAAAIPAPIPVQVKSTVTVTTIP